MNETCFIIICIAVIVALISLFIAILSLMKHNEIEDELDYKLGNIQDGIDRLYVKDGKHL